MKFNNILQLDSMDCGPACLKMVMDYHGRNISLQLIREKCYISREGVSLEGIANAAEEFGLRTVAVKITYNRTNGIPGLTELPLPCIVHWEQRHFVVVYKINSKHVCIADPAHGKIKLTRAQFCLSWCSDDDYGIALELEQSPDFFKEIGGTRSANTWANVLPYLRPYRRLIIQFMIGIMAGLVLQVIFPFLTQSLIDVGVQNQNLSFITLILIAQLVLFSTQTFVQFVQAWIILQIGKRVNVSLISDFLMRLIRLPIGYFDSKNVGDLMQRIQDNNRVEGFLTGSVLNIFFAFLTLIVFSVILLMYNVLIFGVFMLFSFLYVFWILMFMKRRADLDYLGFQQSSETQSSLFEMINGMQEIKLQGSERKRRWKWIDIQGKLFRVQSKSLALRQYQDFGALFFNRIRDIIITFIAAGAVIEGSITLGTMFAIQYIVGQLSSPFNQFISFVRSAQDARISLDRMAEITDVTPEEDPNVLTVREVPKEAKIRLENLSFAYSPLAPDVLKNLNLTIPSGKITAIVGESGSGKTTLLKLLLGFYPPTGGKVFIGERSLETINKKVWRSKCGTVMQDGFVFSDTIGANIAESDNVIDLTKLEKALQIANIHDFVYSMPLNHNTMIGARGSGVSQGQRQRIFIARAVYKDPDYLFFDEATNALDATNEKIIMENLNKFFDRKTVVVVAHRLSTVKNADQIVVLDKAKIVEIGTHKELVAKRGKYWELVENQLDLE